MQKGHRPSLIYDCLSPFDHDCYHNSHLILQQQFEYHSPSSSSNKHCTHMNIHDPLHRTSQGDWYKVRNRNSCVVAPVIVPGISYTGSSCDVEHIPKLRVQSDPSALFWVLSLCLLPLLTCQILHNCQYKLSGTTELSASLSAVSYFWGRSGVQTCISLSGYKLKCFHGHHLLLEETSITQLWYRSLTGPRSWNSALTLEILWRDPRCCNTEICHTYISNALLLFTYHEVALHSRQAKVKFNWKHAFL